LRKKLIGIQRGFGSGNFFVDYYVILRRKKDVDELEEFVSQSARTAPNVLVTATMNISGKYKERRPKQKLDNSFFEAIFKIS